MQDTINSIRVTLSERIGNPFISATIISCTFINWKLSLLLFSDTPYDSKVEKVIGLYPDFSTRLDNFLIYPICFGFFWTVIWPLINLFFNTYWYWMKSNISNLKLKAERKKKLSEAEAAELYSTIDAQESKYLEFLKDRQSKIDSLTKQIASLTSERAAIQSEAEDHKSKGENLALELSKIKEDSASIQRESEKQRRSLDEILDRSLEFAEYLPGLKAITSSINKAPNFRADQDWIMKELKHQEPNHGIDDQQKMVHFFLALGLIKRDSNNHIVFGDRYRYIKDKVLGINNSSGQTKPQ